MEQNKKVLKLVLAIAGLILVISVYGWGRSGYYMRDLPVMGALLLAGVVCLIIAAKIKAPPKKGENLPLSDKWKCRCGSYNDNGDDACWNCGEKRPK
jgi:hypothetical protein